MANFGMAALTMLACLTRALSLGAGNDKFQCQVKDCVEEAR